MARPSKTSGSFRQNATPKNLSGSFRQNPSFVMAGHSRPKDGVASLAYVPAIHALLRRQAWMPATSAGMTVESDASYLQKISASRFSPCMCRAAGQRCRAAHPGGLSCQVVGFEPFASQVRVAERRNSQPRIAATVG
jgi:hypothetical protein